MNREEPPKEETGEEEGERWRGPSRRSVGNAWAGMVTLLLCLQAFGIWPSNDKELLRVLYVLVRELNEQAEEQPEEEGPRRRRADPELGR